MRRTSVVASLAAVLLLAVVPSAVAGSPATAGGGERPAGALRLNDLQARGTHNSYHRDPGFPGREAAGWDYSHRRLGAQLEHQDVRQVELDVRYNWARDDFEVYHAWFGDDRSTCALLSDCLAEIRAWSDAHAGHHPVMVLIEPKDGGPPRNTDLPEDGDPFTRPMGEAEYVKLDAVLFEAFDGPTAAGGRVVTPDAVQAGAPTLREAVLQAGWPRIDDVRQHVLYVIDGDDHAADYSRGWSDLSGRAMFVQADPEQPVAGFVSRDGPRLPGERDKYDRMARVVSQGFMVRDLVSPSGFERAKAAGAQFLSTDFPEQLELSGRTGVPSRCNPVTTASEPCNDGWIETHRHREPYEVEDDPSDSTEQVARDKVDRLVVRSAGSAVALVGEEPPGGG